MEQKTLIITLSLLIIAAAVTFNFEEFTGQAGRLWVLEESMAAQPKGEGSVTVEPKVLEAGEYIYMTIKPGDICISNEITIYKKDRKLPIVRFKRSAQYKGSSTGTTKYCKETTISYKTWTSWEEGDYYVQVKELPTRVSGQVGSRTTYYTDDFHIKNVARRPKIVISSVGDLFNSPQVVAGQRYIFRD